MRHCALNSATVAVHPLSATAVHPVTCLQRHRLQPAAQGGSVQEPVCSCKAVHPPVSLQPSCFSRFQSIFHGLRASPWRRPWCCGSNSCQCLKAGRLCIVICADSSAHSSATPETRFLSLSTSLKSSSLLDCAALEIVSRLLALSLMRRRYRHAP